jgi:hypothetical protein
MIKFKQKDFSNYIVSDAVKGATIGAAVGSVIGGGAAPEKLPVVKFLPGAKEYNNLRHGKKDTEGKIKQQLAIMGTSVILGAALGALLGTVKEIDKHVSQGNADDRLMGSVIKELEKKGYKEGKEFTRDPKQASTFKVCIVLTRDGANLRLLVNVIKDPKLKQTTDKVIRSLTGKPQVRNNTASNKYNEISISTISNTPSNIKTVTELASGFIKAGYPTYIVEVG